MGRVGRVGRGKRRGGGPDEVLRGWVNATALCRLLHAIWSSVVQKPSFGQSIPAFHRFLIESCQGPFSSSLWKPLRDMSFIFLSIFFVFVFVTFPLSLSLSLSLPLLLSFSFLFYYLVFLCLLLILFCFCLVVSILFHVAVHKIGFNRVRLVINRYGLSS